MKDIIDMVNMGYRVYILNRYKEYPFLKYVKLDNYPHLVFIKDDYEK